MLARASTSVSDAGLSDMLRASIACASGLTVFGTGTTRVTWAAPDKSIDEVLLETGPSSPRAVERPAASQANAERRAAVMDSWEVRIFRFLALAPDRKKSGGFR